MDYTYRVIEVGVMTGDKQYLVGLFTGVVIGIGLILTFLTVVNFPDRQKEIGYYEAYKKFKQDKLEQCTSDSLKLRYETELLHQKYKEK